MKSPFFRSGLVVLPLLVIFVVMAVWNPHGEFWGTVEPPKAQCEAYDAARLKTATTPSADIYDARKLGRLLREPQNTGSNLAYVFVGLAVLFAASRRLSAGFGATCVFLGIGSGLYHASLQAEWRMVDILGVYAVLFALGAIGVSAFLGLRGKAFDLAVLCLVIGAAFAAGVHRNDVRIGGFKVLDSTYVVVGGVSLASALAVLCVARTKSRTRYFWALSSLAGFSVIAFFGGIADRFGGRLANPDALVQGHSLWHACGALALLAVYELFASAGFDRSVFENVGRDGCVARAIER